MLDGTGVRCPRTETLNSGRADQAYAVHIVKSSHPVALVSPSAVDSDEEEEIKRVHLCARVSAAGHEGTAVAMSSISSRLYCCGDQPLVLEPGDGAWIPVKASSECVARTGSTMKAQKLKYFEDGPEDELEVVPGIFDNDSSEEGIHLSW